jgi:hypothetical protein
LQRFGELVFSETLNQNASTLLRRDAIGHNPSLAQSGKAVPRKFICSKSRTTHLTPTSFTDKQLKLSNTLPSCNISRKFIFGLKSKDLYSGSPLHCLPPDRTNRNRVVVYSAAALGIIHDMTANTQKYFECHTDDITCLSLDPSGTYALSGQLGE